MKVAFDPEKRRRTLDGRGLDMASAGEIFDGATLTVEDDRRDYGEPRFITIGFLEERMVALVWTPRNKAMRVISLRKCNEREQAAYGDRLR